MENVPNQTIVTKKERALKLKVIGASVYIAFALYDITTFIQYHQGAEPTTLSGNVQQGLAILFTTIQLVPLIPLGFMGGMWLLSAVPVTAKYWIEHGFIDISAVKTLIHDDLFD